MNSYREHAIMLNTDFEKELKLIKISSCPSEYIFLTQCIDLLNKKRDDFNKGVIDKSFGEISF